MLLIGRPRSSIDAQARKIETVDVPTIEATGPRGQND